MKKAMRILKGVAVVLGIVLASLIFAAASTGCDDTFVDLGACMTSEDCDDSDSCTVDICDQGGECQHAMAPECLPEPQCEVDADCTPFSNVCYTFVCEDGNCRGVEWDQDGDGIGPCGMIECDDLDPAQHSGAPEICNGEDDDCDGETDEDCDECVPAEEVCSDFVDNDCDGSVDEGCPCDLTRIFRICGFGPGPAYYCGLGTQYCNTDGVITECVGGTPAGEEVCDFAFHTDADCDGLWNDEDPDCEPEPECVVDADCAHLDSECLVFRCLADSCFAYERDDDGDGRSLCGGLPEGEHYDCDDGNADVHPGATERCNGVDDDCDGETDEDYLDDLGDVCVIFRPDGYCETFGVITCNLPGEMHQLACDSSPPGTAWSRPLSFDMCGNGLDDNCNAVIDEGC